MSAAPSAAFDLTGSPFRLVPGAHGGLAAEGPLTFASARRARQLGLEALAGTQGQPPLEIDCQGVTAADSAGLAVLLDWLAVAKANGRSLRYLHLPAGLTALASISEVTALVERGV